MGILEIKTKPIVEDIGANLKMNNRGFLRIFQEVANIASTQIGFGITQTEATHFTWVILYWRLEILKRPEYEDELTVKTWATFSKKIYSIRNFELYVGDELVARADSKWTLVDTESHKVLKIPEEMMEKYGVVEERVFPEDLKEKFVMPEDIDNSFVYKIMKRDLDANHHVNNLSYLSIASEIVPNEIIDNATFLSIVFKKEITYNDTIECYYKDNIVYIYNSENDTFHGAVIIK